MVKSDNRKVKTTKTPPGPKATTLKIEGNWEDAVKKSFNKKRPPKGWPKE